MRKNYFFKKALMLSLSASLIWSPYSSLSKTSGIVYAESADDDVPAPDPDVEDDSVDNGPIEHEEGDVVNLFADAGKIEQLPQPAVKETEPPLPVAEDDGEDKSTIDRQQDGVYGTIVRVRTGYVFSDGSFVEWTSGVGYLITKDKLLTAKSLVEVGQNSSLYKNIRSQYAGAYKENGVDLSDYASVKKNIKTYVVADAGTVQCSINEDASGDSFALLELETPVNAYATAVFAEDMPVEGDEIGITGTMMTDSESALLSTNIYIKNAKVTAIRKSGQSLYVDFEGSFSTLSPGAPIVDSDKNIIGMVTDGASGRGSALSLDTIRSALDGINIEYSVVNDSGADVADLETIIEQAKEIDLTDITDESLSVLNDALKNGISVAEEPMASRRRIEEAINQISAAMDQVAYNDHSGERATKRMRIFLLIFVLVLMLSVPFVIKQLRKEDWQLKEDTQNFLSLLGFGKRRTSSDGDDNAKTKQKVKKEKKTNKEITKKEKSDSSKKKEAAHAGDGEENGNGQTTVLRMSPKVNAYLFDKATGEVIRIKKSPFTIGCDPTCDFAIAKNSAVSHLHCTITNRGAAFYITDNDSTNGTYLDGTEIEPNQRVALKDRLMITVADMEYIFRIEDNEDAE